MENKIEKISKKLLAPSWMFWINKREIIEFLVSTGKDGFPALKNIVKFISATPINDVVVMAFQVFAMIVSPFHRVMYEESGDVTYNEASNLIKKAIEQNNLAKNLNKPPIEISAEFKELVGLLQKKDKVIIEFTLRCLGVIGPYSFPYLSEIEKFVNDENIQIKLTAEYAIANITGNDKTFISDAISILNSYKSDDIKDIAACLLQFANNCQINIYIKELMSAYNNNKSNKTVQSAIINCLQYSLHNEPIGSDKIIIVFPILCKALGDSDLRGLAKGALIYIGPATVPHLIEILEKYKSYNEDIVISCAIVLGKIGKAAISARESISNISGKFDENADNYIRWSLKDLEKD